MWLAKGACGPCGRPVARRAPWPGPTPARCNVCQRQTPLVAWRVRTGRARLAVTAAALAFVAIFVLGGAPQAARTPAADGAWVALEQTLVPTAESERVLYHVETRAFDARGGLVPADATALPEWRFAAAPSLSDPGALAWEPCGTPPACAFSAPADHVIHFAPYAPGLGPASAYDPRDGTAWLHLGAWTRWDDAAEGLTLRFTTEDGP